MIHHMEGIFAGDGLSIFMNPKMNDANFLPGLQTGEINIIAWNKPEKIMKKGIPRRTRGIV